MLTSLSYGDAIGNETVAIYRMLREEGYDTSIYAEYRDDRMKAMGISGEISPRLCFSSEDIIIYHLSTGSKWNTGVFDFGTKVIIIYHNITPPIYLGGPDNVQWYLAEKGTRDLRIIANKVKFCIAVSEYNKGNLIANGFDCNISVIPLLIPFDDYKKEASQTIIQNCSNIDSTKILFTGRVAPNKKFEDIIAAFNEYRLRFDKDAVLFFVGKYNENDRYYKKLREYVDTLSLANVVFTGHLSFDEILAYYSIADCFLCMSEHEGFCVPLVEAVDIVGSAETFNRNTDIKGWDQTNLTIGLQYWFYKKCRIQAQYTRAICGSKLPNDYNIIQAQMQVAF